MKQTESRREKYTNNNAGHSTQINSTYGKVPRLLLQVMEKSINIKSTDGYYARYFELGIRSEIVNKDRRLEARKGRKGWRWWMYQGQGR